MTPIVMMVNADSGTVCRITYNGKVKEWKHMWPAIMYYRQLTASHEIDVDNAKVLELCRDSILDAASTSSIIPSSPCYDCAPNNMGPS